jgi:hypothetical protein
MVVVRLIQMQSMKLIEGRFCIRKYSQRHCVMHCIWTISPVPVDVNLRLKQCRELGVTRQFSLSEQMNTVNDLL